MLSLVCFILLCELSSACVQHNMYVTQENKRRVMVKRLSIHLVNNEEEALDKFFKVYSLYIECYRSRFITMYIYVCIHNIISDYNSRKI